MADEQKTPWRNVKQAATRGLVSPRTIYGEVKAGRLRAAIVGGRRSMRFRDEWIDAWLEASAPQEITSGTRKTT
jgi:excisionase family DNA binding protein